MDAREATYRFDLWSTTGTVVVTDPAALGTVVEIVRSGLDEVERACSRFRPDSEISGLTPGRHRLSPMLADLVGTALDAAEASSGLVDPTVGGVVRALGYDRSIELLPADGAPVSLVHHVPGWRQVHLYGDKLELPAGVHLDLGATAKARAADLMARRAAETVGVGVLVELGGDIATAGPGPDGGWQVLVRDTDDDAACPGHAPARLGGRDLLDGTTRVAPRRRTPAPHRRPPNCGPGRARVAQRDRGRTHVHRGEHRLDRGRDPRARGEPLALRARLHRPARRPTPPRRARRRLAPGGSRMSAAFWALGRGTGVVALVLFTVSLVLGIVARSGRPVPWLGRFGTSDLHRTAALTGTGLVLAHVATLYFDPYAQLRLVDVVFPFLGAYKPLWLGLGTLALDLLAVVTVVSLLQTACRPAASSRPCTGRRTPCGRWR